MGSRQRNLFYLTIVFIPFTPSSPAAESLPKPQITMSPAGEVTWGQDVTINCSIPTHQLLLEKFTLMKNAGLHQESQTRNNMSAAFNISKVDFDSEGSYNCLYSVQHFNTSPTSDTVRINVTVRLPQPSISLTSSNGGLVLSPAEVTRGYSFVITCSINCSYPEGRFFLIFSGSNINKSSVNHSASFDFPVAEYEHQGSYSCVYEVTLSARRFNSTETTPIVVIVKVPLSHLVSSVAGGCLLLLLLVLLVVWLFCTRRRRAKQPEAHVQTPMTDNNHYEDDDNEENYDDEDKGDYVNIELLDTNRKQGEEVEGMEEEENEDYENMTTEDIYIEAVDTFAIVQNNREQEDEEEPSDDEQDYVNVSPDIYLSN